MWPREKIMKKRRKKKQFNRRKYSNSSNKKYNRLKMYPMRGEVV